MDLYGRYKCISRLFGIAVEIPFCLASHNHISVWSVPDDRGIRLILIQQGTRWPPLANPDNRIRRAEVDPESHVLWFGHIRDSLANYKPTCSRYPQCAAIAEVPSPDWERLGPVPKELHEAPDSPSLESFRSAS